MRRALEARRPVGYFLDLYRYAFTTGNTTELKMSEDQCKILPINDQQCH